MAEVFDGAVVAWALTQSAVWMAARRIVRDLIEGHDDGDLVLREILATKGECDWVWVEESIDAELACAGMMNAAERERREVYLATFGIVVGGIRARWPDVQPPVWFTREQSSVR